MKRIAALCLTVLLLLGLWGCSEVPPEEQALRDVGKHMSELDSFACSVSGDLSIGIKGLKLPVSLRGSGAFHREPQTCQISLALSNDLKPMSMELYTEVLDGSMVVYTGINSGQGLQWSRTTLPEQKDIMYRLMKCLTLLGQVEEVPDDTCSDHVVRYDCKVAGEFFRKLGSFLDVEGMLGKLRGQEAAEPEEPAEPFTVSCYVDESQDKLLELRADLSAFFKNADGAQISIRFHSFDSAVDVSIPEAARAAE